MDQEKIYQQVGGFDGVSINLGVASPPVTSVDREYINSLKEDLTKTEAANALETIWTVAVEQNCQVFVTPALWEHSKTKKKIEGLSVSVKINDDTPQPLAAYRLYTEKFDECALPYYADLLTAELVAEQLKLGGNFKDHEIMNKRIKAFTGDSDDGRDIDPRYDPNNGVRLKPGYSAQALGPANYSEVTGRPVHTLTTGISELTIKRQRMSVGEVTLRVGTDEVLPLKSIMENGRYRRNVISIGEAATKSLF